MDLHEYDVVANNYDFYVNNLTRNSGLDTDSCVSFHIALAQEHGNKGILDIACGTGATTIPLLENDFKVYSIDVSQGMIEVLKTKIAGNSNITPNNAHLFVENMMSFQLNRQFSLAMIPRTGFMHLLSSDDQRAALNNINQHLVDGGILTLNTFDPSLPMIAGSKNDPDYIKRTEFKNNNGNTVELHCATKYIQEEQLIESSFRFDEFDGNKLVSSKEAPAKLRYTFRQEMMYLFELTGYEIIDVYGSYDRAPATYPSHNIWVVRKLGQQKSNDK